MISSSETDYYSALVTQELSQEVDDICFVVEVETCMRI